MSTLLVERAGHAVVQDLGRPGWGHVGIATNGAADGHAARVANVLVGNAEQDPVVEVTGSDLTLRPTEDTLLAVTGGATCVLVDGHSQPAWEALVVGAGSQVVVPFTGGYRSYVAVNGTISAPPTLGSVAPDALLDVGLRLATGDRISVRTRYDAGVRGPYGPYGRLFRLGAERPATPKTAQIGVTVGPDLHRVRGGVDLLRRTFAVSQQSDHVGLRLTGPDVALLPGPEILSRGVPVGAVEVTPSGDTIVLLRGRLVTAGYPVVAIATSDALDRLGQVAPGDEIRFAPCDVRTAHERLRWQVRERADLAERVHTAFTASGLGPVLSPDHRGRQT